ncbi:MAG TPA: MFS transporter [Gaiellaceae bacterium]|nr:MFS transporter [Gaiellaceae bacterium]
MQTVPAGRRLRVLDALQHRDFRLLFAGQTISQVGDAAFVVALGWRAFTLTGKASSLGIVLMVEAFGLITTLLVGGVLADRYSRRLLLIGSDVARAVLVAGLAVVDATGHVSFGVLIVFVACHGLGSGLFQPAFGGILPLLVEESTLGSANALIGVSRQAALVLGPAFAGSIYGSAGSSTVFAADALSFLVSAALLAPARPRVIEVGPTEGLRRELTSGFRYVLRVPWLWRTIGTFTLVLMIGYAALQVLLPKLVETQWHGGVGSYGLLFTLQGIGMVLGSIVLGQTAPTRRRGVLIYGLLAINNVLAILLALSPWFWAASLVQVGRGFCVGFAITLWDTMVMQRVPEHMLSRVISMDWFGSLGLLPAGLGLWAVLSGLGPPGTLIAASAAFCALLFCLGLFDLRIRDLD